MMTLGESSFLTGKLINYDKNTRRIMSIHLRNLREYLNISDAEKERAHRLNPMITYFGSILFSDDPRAYDASFVESELLNLNERIKRLEEKKIRQLEDERLRRSSQSSQPSQHSQPLDCEGVWVPLPG